MHRVVLFLLSLILLTNSYAQNAWEKDLSVANAYYEQHAFNQAIVYYEKSIQLKNRVLSYSKLADCYFQTRNFYDANRVYKLLEKYYGSSLENTLMVARTELFLGNYSVSKSVLKTIPDSLRTQEVTLLNASCDSVLKWKPQPVKIVNLKKLNSEASEVAPVPVNNELIFSSDRTNITFKRSFEQTGASFFNLYSVKTNSKGKWLEPKNISTEINTGNHEGAACFNPNGKEIYFTRSEYTQKENINKSDENRLKLYKSSYKNGHWSKPLWFMMNDSLHSFGHPCLSPDENFFFFVADLPSGFGGTDIYLSIKLTDTTWTDPINLGKHVNTTGNELYPHFTSQNKLYFSSNGHTGYGGYDLFKTKYDDGKWQDPVNLKKGINSSYDDFSIFFKQTNSGYFSSNRPGGKGREDLYLFILK